MAEKTVPQTPSEGTKPPNEIDRMDQNIDVLRTVWLALHADSGWLGDDSLRAMASTLDTAIEELCAVRDAFMSKCGGMQNA